MPLIRITEDRREEVIGKWQALSLSKDIDRC